MLEIEQDRSLSFPQSIKARPMEREEEEVTLSFPLWPDDPAQQDAAAALQGRGNASQSICFRSSAFPTSLPSRSNSRILYMFHELYC
jgi:hypothetical protein